MPGTTTYLKFFTNTLTVEIRGCDHQFTTPNLAIAVLTCWPPLCDGFPTIVTRTLLPSIITLNPHTYDIVVHLSSAAYPGLIAIWPEDEPCPVALLKVPLVLPDARTLEAQAALLASREPHLLLKHPYREPA